MSLTSTASLVTHRGNGATTVFPYTFPILKAEHAQVWLTDDTNSTLLTAGQYTIAGIGNTDPAGGTVTCVDPATAAPIANTKTLTIRRVVPYRQETVLRNQGAFHTEAVEKALDTIVMLCQQLADDLARTPKVPLSDGTTGDDIMVFLSAVQTYAQQAQAAALAAAQYGNAIVPVVKKFVGNGATTQFALGLEPATLSNVLVIVGGVFQPDTTYTFSGTGVDTKIVFSEAPPADPDVVNNVVVIIGGVVNGGTLGGNPDIHGLLTASASALDEIVLYSNANNANRKITLATLLKLATSAGYVAGRLYFGPGMVPSGSNSVLNTGLTYYVPIVVTERRAFAALEIGETGTTNHTTRLGIYASAAGAPAARLFEGSLTNGTSGPKTVAFGQTLEPGLYFLAIQVTSATPGYSYATVTGSIVGELLGFTGHGSSNYVTHYTEAVAGGLPAAAGTLTPVAAGSPPAIALKV